MIKPTTLLVIFGMLTIIIMLGLVGFIAYKYVLGLRKQRKIEKKVEEVVNVVEETPPPQPVEIKSTSEWWEDNDQLFT